MRGERRESRAAASRPTMANVQSGPPRADQRQHLPNEPVHAIDVRQPVHRADEHQIGQRRASGGRREVLDVDAGRDLVRSRSTPNILRISAGVRRQRPRRCGPARAADAGARKRNMRSACRRKYRRRSGSDACSACRRQIMVSTLCWKKHGCGAGRGSMTPARGSRTTTRSKRSRRIRSASERAAAPASGTG